VVRVLFSFWMVTSRKLTWLLENSEVNLMVNVEGVDVVKGPLQ
jgi:hypothetical protein